MSFPRASLAYPAATQALLDEGTQQAVGQEMALRRGVGQAVRLHP